MDDLEIDSINENLSERTSRVHIQEKGRCKTCEGDGLQQYSNYDTGCFQPKRFKAHFSSFFWDLLPIQNKHSGANQTSTLHGRIKLMSLGLVVFFFYNVMIPHCHVAWRGTWIMRSRDFYNLNSLPKGQKYLWYAPHSGLANQGREMRHALMIGMLLKRTVIIPPKNFRHHDVGGGSCMRLKFLKSTSTMLANSWGAITKLITESSYVSMGDIYNLSTISPHIVKTIDLRVFLALWCGADVQPACSGPACISFSNTVPVRSSLDACGLAVVNHTQPSSVYRVEDTCQTTTWVYPTEHGTNVPVSDNSTKTVRKSIMEHLGPGSAAGNADIIAFGSTYSTRPGYGNTYLDIQFPTNETQLDLDLQILADLQFSDDIKTAANIFVHEEIGKQFYCAHVRLRDGVFLVEKVRKQTLKRFKEFLASIQSQHSEQQNQSSTPLPKPILFLMTDTPTANWSSKETILPQNWLHLVTLDNPDHQMWIREVFANMVRAEGGFKSGVPRNVAPFSRSSYFSHDQQFDLELSMVVEQEICSRATEEFFGTGRSSISSQILKMRSHKFPSNSSNTIYV